MSESNPLGLALAAQAARFAAGQEHKARLYRTLVAIAETGRYGTGSVRSDLGEIIGRIEEFRTAMDMSFAAESQALAVIAAALRDIRSRAR